MTKISIRKDPKTRKNHVNIVKKRKRIQANDELLKKLKAELKSSE